MIKNHGKSAGTMQNPGPLADGGHEAPPSKKPSNPGAEYQPEWAYSRSIYEKIVNRTNGADPFAGKGSM